MPESTPHGLGMSMRHLQQEAAGLAALFVMFYSHHRGIETEALLTHLQRLGLWLSALDTSVQI